MEMLATVKKYDLICFQLRNNLYAQLENPMKKELNRLSTEIKTLITSGKRVEGQSISMLSQIFNLRIKAIKWLTTDANFDYLEMLNSVVPQIEELNSTKKLNILTENILFALRCNQRVAEAIIGTNVSSAERFSDLPAKLPEITYEQFITSLAFAIPEVEMVQKIVNWTNASLHIEFVMVAADIINTEKLKVSDKIINELAFLVADAAQEYIALATELGILKPHSSRQSISNLSFDNSFVKEQKQLADLGLDEFAKNLF